MVEEKIMLPKTLCPQIFHSNLKNFGKSQQGRQK